MWLVAGLMERKKNWFHVKNLQPEKWLETVIRILHGGSDLNHGGTRALMNIFKDKNCKRIQTISIGTVESRKQVELILKCQVLELGLYLRL